MTREQGSDAQIFRRAVAIGASGLGAVLLLVGANALFGHKSPKLGGFAAPAAPSIQAAAPVLELEPLDDELRSKGFRECNPHDPIGLGPYAPYRSLSMGRILTPREGGHTRDMGYDVVVHFHGHEAARKILVQVARGVAFVGIDKGLGSGPYADAFQMRDAFPLLRTSIEHALQAASGDEHAHIRHLALTAWSAGYGAVNEILKHGDDGIDAVVLLDALHAGWNPGHEHNHDPESASSAYVQPVFDFAKRALAGDKIFIFTHSEVDPVTYPSTSQTAALLLSQLGLHETPANPGDDPFGLTSSVDVKTFHVWAYRGNAEEAHCSQLRHLARAIRDLIEPAWQTPAMKREPEIPAARGASEASDAGPERAESAPQLAGAVSASARPP